MIMKIFEENNNLIIEDAKDFDLKQTFECGQCFRWDYADDAYTGVAFGKALKIRQSGNRITLENTTLSDWESTFSHYFDSERDYGRIKAELSHDEKMKEAISFGQGIRILNQDPFEALISFIISASNNIPRIKKIISTLCQCYGNEITYCGNKYYAFPTPERIAALSAEEIDVIKSGFRGKYILAAANAVKNGQINLEELKDASYDYAKSQLMKLPGVGNKVSDCVLLFGLSKHSGFPVDVWVKRIMEFCYFQKETPVEDISAFAKKNFGELGGYAQQYLFYWARENKIGV